MFALIEGRKDLLGVAILAECVEEVKEVKRKSLKKKMRNIILPIITKQIKEHGIVVVAKWKNMDYDSRSIIFEKNYSEEKLLKIERTLGYKFNVVIEKKGEYHKVIHAEHSKWQVGDRCSVENV